MEVFYPIRVLFYPFFHRFLVFFIFSGLWLTKKLPVDRYFFEKNFSESKTKFKLVLQVMADKMVSNPRSPFHDPETMNINKIKVYKFLGMGQVHYIFCRERLAYWISAPPADGEELLLYFL